MRQPHARNWPSGSRANSASAAVPRNAPAGPPALAKDAAKPRFEVDVFVRHVLRVDALGALAVTETPDFGEDGVEALGGHAQDERHVGGAAFGVRASGTRDESALALGE